MIRVDGTEVAGFARQLQNVPADMRKELRPRLRQAAQGLAARARRNASWSTRIPGAVKVRAGFGGGSRGGVQVYVDSRQAPHARPLEGMSVSRGGEGLTRGATFRHPVFGGDTWVEQESRPFLMPAVRESGDDTVREVQKAIDSALRKL